MVPEYLRAPTKRECLMKEMTYNFSNTVLPERAPMREAFDALRLQADCGLTPPAPHTTASLSADGSRLTRPFNVYAAAQPQPTRHSSHRAHHQRTHSAHANANVNALELFVDFANGADSNTGSLAAPLKTIAKAVLMARVAGSPASTTISLRAGTHYVSSPIVLTAADSGLTIANYANEQAVVSGAALLKGLAWKPYGSSGLYSADLSAAGVKPFTQLFVNARRAVRARYPNADPETTGLHTANTGYMSGAKSWLAPQAKPAALEVHMSTPTRTPSYFPTFDMGIGGPCDGVFFPPQSYWCLANPSGGGAGTHVLPSGLVYDPTVFSNKTWAHPETGIVHAYHSGHWEGWQFQLDSRDAASNTLKWTKGGFQGARGARGGAEFYVENVFEELDSQNEWFLDTSANTLYYYPNSSNPNWRDSTFEVAQLASVLRIMGSAAAPVRHVTLTGLTFAHTATTFMEAYEVPSGGDWSIHRNGALFLEGTEDVVIEKCLFFSLGSTAVFISNYNRRAAVRSSEFVWLAESAVAAIGTVALVDGTTGNQPIDTVMEKCLVHEIGVFGKQTSAFIQSLAARSIVRNNVMFNGPRAGINFNDGFGGGHVVEYNSMFNWVRETDDHGCFNSWDRLPYLTTFADPQGKQPSLTPATIKIRKNIFMGNYRSVWPIDHDDGSAFYEDSDNVILFGGFKSYLGHSKNAFGNLYIYPDLKVKLPADAYAPAKRLSIADGKAHHSVGLAWGVTCMEYCPPTGEVGHQDNWTNNTCVTAGTYAYDFGTCDVSSLKTQLPGLSGNTLYMPNAAFAAMCGSTPIDLATLQAAGFDTDVVLRDLPADETVVAWAKKLLNF